MYGLDLLGLGSPKWDIKSTLNKFPSDFALGCFGGGWPHAFGDPRPNVKKIIEQCGCKTIRVHLWWDGNNAPAQSAHAPAPLDFIRHHAPQWEQLAQEYPTVKFYVSPSCEYRPTPLPYLQQMINIVEQLAPSCIPILTPEGNAAILPGAIKEEHGSGATANANETCSWDGQSCVDGNMTQWKKTNENAIIKFLWVELFNMKEAHNMQAPNDRTASPNQKDYESIIRLVSDIGSPLGPNFTGHIVPFSRPNLYKVWAEDLPGQNPRDKKPLVIIKEDVPSIDAVDYKGKSLGKFIRFGPYPGGLTRYYSGMPGAMELYGWQIADKCMAQSGSPWGWFKVGNTYYGPVNFSFRAGFFQ